MGVQMTRCTGPLSPSGCADGIRSSLSLLRAGSNLLEPDKHKSGGDVYGGECWYKGCRSLFIKVGYNREIQPVCERELMQTIK
jgi:hypothetical protein